MYKHPSCHLIVFVIGVKKTHLQIKQSCCCLCPSNGDETGGKNAARVCLRVFAHLRSVNKRTCSWDLIASFQSRRSHRDAGDRSKVPFGKYDGGAIRQGQGHRACYLTAPSRVSSPRVPGPFHLPEEPWPFIFRTGGRFCELWGPQ